MDENKLTISQLAQKVNEELKGKISADARHASELSERRIRDYISKGILDKPFGQGHNKWFGQLHIDKLVGLRQLQSDGLSDSSLKKLSSQATDTDSSMRADALNFLSNISGASASTTGQVISSYYSSKLESSKAIIAVQKQVSKVWNEYQLDDEGKVFLRVDSLAKVKNKEEILNQIKSILNIGEKK